MGLLVQPTYRNWREERPLSYEDRESKADIPAHQASLQMILAPAASCLTDHKKESNGTVTHPLVHGIIK